jgi:hypothetical protein
VSRIGRETFLGAALLGALVLVALRPITDPDLWWHLAAGRRVLAGEGVPWVDTFSYVARGHVWIAYSWLPETVFAAVDRTFGSAALVVLAAALVAATMGIVLRTCRAAGARPSVAVVATAAAALVASPAWTVRPHLVSFLCLAVFCHLLTVDRARGDARLGLLVPTMLVWANAHVLFPFGLVLLAAHAATRGRAWWGTGAARWRRVALLAAVGAAPLATPYGWHLLVHLIVVARQPVAFGLVSEFQTPSLHETGGLALAAFLFATLAVLVFSPARKDPADLIGVFLFAWLALAMRRNVPFFAIVAAPVLAGHADALLPFAPAAPAASRREGLLHAGLLAALAAAIVWRAAVLFAPGAAVSRDAFPVAAVDFLRHEGLHGRLLNHFDWGGYLIGNLPGVPVAIDGRTQVYGEETLRQYRDMVWLRPGWRGFLERTDPEVVLWPRRAAFTRILEMLPEWRRVYRDEVATVFVRRGRSDGEDVDRAGRAEADHVRQPDLGALDLPGARGAAEVGGHLEDAGHAGGAQRMSLRK